MRALIAPLFALATALAPVAAGPVAAQTYVIADTDGYGTGECLAAGGTCGKIIADGWCESKGFKAASEFRVALPDDITGSTKSDVGRRTPTSFVIVCRK